VRPGNVKPALLLAGLGLAAAVVLAGLHQSTRDRIAEERQQRALAAVASMLAEVDFDNELLDDSVRLAIPGLDAPARVYRARLGARPVAVVMDVVTSAGYSGDIRLLVAVDSNGTVLGVRVTEQRETPGLGDRIDHRRSDWIEQFAGRSLGDPPAEDWAPDRRGGAFDTLTSATITSAAVTEAVRRALAAFDAQRDRILHAGDRSP